MYRNTNWVLCEDDWDVEEILKEIDAREFVTREDRYYEDFDASDYGYMDRYLESRESETEMY